MTSADNAAMGLSNAPTLLAGNLGGMTLAPGLYQSTSSLEISSGDLTLDGKGDPNAVFVFQTVSTLVVTTGRSMTLTNGEKAAKVFWAVGSLATRGTYSSFAGNILAYASISIQTGAVLNGRALARIGAVTLDNTTLVLPAP